MRWTLLLFVLLACEGPVGPEGDPGQPGEPGPGERVTFSGFSEALAKRIPLERFDPESPPLLACYRREGEVVSPTPYCVFQRGDTGWHVTAGNDATNWEYRVVLVY